MTELWNPETAYLPPIEFRRLAPGEKIPTPTDERGLIEIDRLIADLNKTIDPAYEWPKGLSVHHFYWAGNKYPYVRDVTHAHNPAYFCNLPIHKGLLPRVFENYLHLITEEPPVPDQEVREYRVEAWQVAKDLFKSARKTIQWERRARRRRELVARNPAILADEFNGEDIIGEEFMHTMLEKNFHQLERQMHRNARIPREFRLLDFEASPRTIATALGKLVIP